MKRMSAPLALMLVAAPLIAAQPLAAQTGMAQTGMTETLTDPAKIGDAAQKAADQLRGKAKGKLLASKMIGREVTGPGGGTVGTVEDLVVVPGGNVVAVLVKPSNGQPVALPYGALKVSAASSAADKMGLSLPVSLEEARGMQGMQALTEAVTGKGG
jgi:sporulation protein YlmC with PRC-barrel domain